MSSRRLAECSVVKVFRLLGTKVCRVCMEDLKANIHDVFADCPLDAHVVLATRRTAEIGQDRTFRNRDYDEQQNAGLLPDLQALTRQPSRSAIRQLRRRLLGMRRRYRSRNGMCRVARLRTKRIRGRTSARLDRSIQALIWQLR